MTLGVSSAMSARSSTLDTSTQSEYTKSKPAPENFKDFNGSKRQSQILPLRPENPQQIWGFCAVAQRKRANKNRSNNGKIPGNPAKIPGENPRVTGAFAARSRRASFRHSESRSWRGRAKAPDENIRRGFLIQGRALGKRQKGTGESIPQNADPEKKRPGPLDDGAGPESHGRCVIRPRPTRRKPSSIP